MAERIGPRRTATDLADDQPPIILTGMMLSGKTTVGQRVARQLSWAFVDLDEQIERRSGRTIGDWFEQGEASFRQVEREVLASLLSGPEEAQAAGRVVALGGGALEDKVSRALCLARGFVVYLRASARQLAARMAPRTGRPLLDEAPDPVRVLDDLIRRREPNYASAHLVLPAGEMGPDDLAAAIIEAYVERYPSRARRA
jgi:shikimate kinase